MDPECAAEREATAKVPLNIPEHVSRGQNAMALRSHLKDSVVVVTRSVGAHQRLEQPRQLLQGKEEVWIGRGVGERVSVTQIEGADEDKPRVLSVAKVRRSCFGL